MTSIRRRRLFVGSSARFALLAGGRAVTCFRGIVFSLTSISFLAVRKRLERTGEEASGRNILLVRPETHVMTLRNVTSIGFYDSPTNR
jgi:hypothetical protein